jgi:hypothetical protein
MSSGVERKECLAGWLAAGVLNLHSEAAWDQKVPTMASIHVHNLLGNSYALSLLQASSDA